MNVISLGVGSGATPSSSILMGLSANPDSLPPELPPLDLEPFVHNYTNLLERFLYLAERLRDNLV